METEYKDLTPVSEYFQNWVKLVHSYNLQYPRPSSSYQCLVSRYREVYHDQIEADNPSTIEITWSFDFNSLPK